MQHRNTYLIHFTYINLRKQMYKDPLKITRKEEREITSEVHQILFTRNNIRIIKQTMKNLAAVYQVLYLFGKMGRGSYRELLRISSYIHITSSTMLRVGKPALCFYCIHQIYIHTLKLQQLNRYTYIGTSLVYSCRHNKFLPLWFPSSPLLLKKTCAGGYTLEIKLPQ